MKTKAELEMARAEFKGRWIAYGMHLFNRAEALGVDWRNMSLEKLPAAIDFAEEFATPDEYKRNPFPVYQEKE
jgi:hypothetical protein